LNISKHVAVKDNYYLLLVSTMQHVLVLLVDRHQEFNYTSKTCVCMYVFILFY